jgi:hypothetical protein
VASTVMPVDVEVGLGPVAGSVEGITSEDEKIRPASSGAGASRNRDSTPPSAAADHSVSASVPFAKATKS